LGATELEQAVIDETLDMVLTNPSQYLQLEVANSVSRFATLINLRQGFPLTTFGGVILTLNNRNISTFEDIQKASIHAVSLTGLGAYRMQIGYLEDNGVDIENLNVSFVGNQNTITKNVFDGLADVGFIRTDQLERFIVSNPEYATRINEVSVFKEIAADSEYPFRRTTRLYPEWPISTTSRALTKIDVRQLSSAFFSIEQNTTAAIQGGYQQWTSPLNYRNVFLLLDQLGVFDSEQEKCLKTCNQEHGVCNNVSVCVCSIGWEGLTCDIVSPKIERWVRFDNAGTYLIVIVTIILIIVILSMLIYIITIRESKMIKKKAGFWFSVMSLAGFVILLASIFFWLGKPTDVSCGLRVWAISIGFTVAYVGPLVKIWRLSRIFNNNSLKILTIKDSFLAKIAVVVTLIEIIFCIIWQVVAPSEAIVVQVPDSFEKVDHKCSINEYFGFVSVAIKMLLLIIFGWLAFTVRKVASDFKAVDQKYVNLSIYNSMVFSLLFVALLIAIPDKSYDQEFYIVCAGILILTITAVTPLMIPTLILSQNYNSSITIGSKNGDRSALSHGASTIDV